MSLIPENPTWVHDIIPILVKKAKHQENVAHSIAFADYGQLVRTKRDVHHKLSLPETDPHSREIPFKLSKSEKQILLKWLQMPKPLFMDTSDPEQLKEALQLAVEVELATLPPYLTAMYSIIDGTGEANADIKNSIDHIVHQEMNHFGLACNMLVSIGGVPDVTTEEHVPKYPTTLPGGLRSELTVYLRKFSKDQALQFMSMEQPFQSRLPKENAEGIFYVDKTCKFEEHNDTIGHMYEEIQKSFLLLESTGQISIGYADSQIEENRSKIKVFKILTTEDVKQAIYVITEQGEGGLPKFCETGLDPVDATSETGEMAHYFRFSEMYYGRKIRQNNTPATGFSYSGEFLHFNEDGVANMQDDPDLSTLTEGTDAYIAATDLVDAYESMLYNLTNTFAGEDGSTEKLGSAIADMFKIASRASTCMETGIDPSSDITVGTPFQLSPNLRMKIEGRK